MLFDPAVLPAAEEADLNAALSAINEEFKRRISADGGLADLVRQDFPEAVAVLCDVVWDDYPTASAEGVLLVDGTTIDLDEDTAPESWGEVRDMVADLAAVDGAISEDYEHGHLIRFATPPIDPLPAILGEVPAETYADGSTLCRPSGRPSTARRRRQRPCPLCLAGRWAEVWSLPGPCPTTRCVCPAGRLHRRLTTPRGPTTGRLQEGKRL